MPLSRKKRFARNLDKLLETRSLGRKEAAEWAGVPYQWLRRAVTEGISRPETRNIAHLKALADRLGLSSPDRFWDRGLHVDPAPDSIEDEADRLGELMRKYVTLVGPNDGLVRVIQSKLWSGIYHEELRKRQLDAMRREAEREDASRKSELKDLDDSKTRWRRYREAIDRATAGRDSERTDRRRAFEATAEGTGHATSLIKLFDSEFVEGWRAIGVPRVEEVRIDPWIVAAHASAAKGADAAVIASVVSDLWIAEYARLLGKTVDEAQEFIRRFIRDAYRIEEDLIAPVRRSGSSLRGPTDATGERQVRAGGPTTYTRADPVEIPAVVHEALEFLRQYQLRWRDVGLPRIDEVTITPEEVAARPELRKLSDVDRLLNWIGFLFFLPRYAVILGVGMDDVIALIKQGNAAMEGPSAPNVAENEEASGPSSVVDMQAQEEHSEAKVAGAQEAPTPSSDVETSEQAELRRYEERRRVVAREAVELVPKVFAAFDPEQTARIARIFGSRRRAEVWVQAELKDELLRLEYQNAVSSPFVLGEAVKVVVGLLIEDFKTPPGPTKAVEPKRPLIDDEPIAADERSLESRRHVDHLNDEDLGRTSGLIGFAREVEINKMIADDRSKSDEQVERLLERAANIDRKGDPERTFLDDLRRVGDPKTFAKAALVVCDGDFSKAQTWLVREVEKWIRSEKSRTSGLKRPGSAPADEHDQTRTTRKTRRKKKAAGVRPGHVRKAVLRLHRMGAGLVEILDALTNDLDLDDCVRWAKRSRLERVVQWILDHEDGDGGDSEDEYQDFESEDEKLRWEMGYDDAAEKAAGQY